MRASGIFKHVMVSFLIGLILASSIQPVLVRAEDIEIAVPSLDDRNRVIMLYMLGVALSTTPLNTSAKYELFHTVYMYRNGTLNLVNSPYISGEELEQPLNYALETRRMMENGTLTTFKNETGIYVAYNGTISDALLFVNNGSWDMELGPLYNTSLNNNTMIYWRSVKANFSGQLIEYNLIQLIANISDTHKVYITTIGEKLNDTSYSYVYTEAMYWFKDKNTFFGDWIILPEGADSLDQYYEMVANAVQFLYNDVYKGSSPGYVPTSYPQIAKYLNILSKNIPLGYNLRVIKGYALVTDFVISMLVGAAMGALSYTIKWAITTGCDRSKWSWRDFGISVAVGAALGPVGSKLKGAVSCFLKWLPEWARW
ncbi:MAG: hypothetical protein DSO07_01355 [Thermoproteota archaeon]|jgi:hypothetical protein|uniref:Uncharacterized protein n=1 Tax=Candidatus Methanodesulfokora washburnensis TaxID=2478471 RepID=A0A429GNF3_9CREN|nr:hypothetical protein [Candidatus Methanodesulfokores washburnensis]RSN75291.1 hypothetical protein D6D85_06585 [Candidatus Methanodesulfokores washburnensis]RZN61095.1 MAG: hypothetical protein EF810_05135 [Candidatus Methanodesulfokores washburnensis]TDA42027.1 MAG: hypothetical protein DSO07_01355 [Candidatus Korarchaeota archaeon]